MQTIDLETWPRKAHYEHFRAFDCPRWDLCGEIDLTVFRTRCKAEGLSVHHAFVDGLHMARLFEDLQARLNAPG